MFSSYEVLALNSFFHFYYPSIPPLRGAVRRDSQGESLHAQGKVQTWVRLCDLQMKLEYY